MSPHRNIALPVLLFVVASSPLWIFPTEARGQFHSLKGEDDFMRQVSALLDAHKFDELEAMAKTLRKDRPHFPSGHSKLRNFYRGLSWETTDRGPAGDPYRTRLDHLAAWRAAKPDSITASIAEANCWLRYGWYRRGGVYLYTPGADEPDPADRLAAAERLLSMVEKAQPGPVQDPEYYRARVQAALEAGTDRDGLIRLLEQSVAYDATETAPFAAAAVGSLSWRLEPPIEPELLARKAVEMTKGAIGRELYAVVAFETWPYYGSRLFHKFDFSWEETRQGFRDRLKRFPDSDWIMNQFCLLATYANDRETAHELFEKLDGRWDRGLWQSPSNYRKRRGWADPSLLKGDQRAVFADHSDSLLSVAFSPDRQWLASGGGDRRIVVRDAKTGARDHNLDTDHGSGVTALAFSPDGQWLASGGYDATIRLWRMGEREPTVLGRHDGGTRDLAFSPDGRYLASAGQDQQVVLWDAQRRECVDGFQARHGNRVMRVAFRPGSSQLAAVDQDGRLKVWDVPSGMLRHDVQAHPSWSGAVAYSPDGSLIATGAAGGLVRLWNADKGKPAGKFSDVHLPIADLIFSPDGSRLTAVTSSTADGSKPGELLTWDLTSKKLLKKLHGHQSGVWALDVAPDGKTLATVGDDMTLRLWDAP